MGRGSGGWAGAAGPRSLLLSLSHDGDRIWLCSTARCHPPPPHPAPPRRMPPWCMWGPRPPPPAPAMLKDAEAGRAEQEAALCARDGEVARLMEQDPARAEPGRSGPAMCGRGGGPSRGCVGVELVARGEGGGGRPGARSWRLRRAGGRGGRRESGGAWRLPPRPRGRGPRALSPRARGLRVPSRRRLPPWTAEGGQDPAAAMERRGRGAAAEAANSRGGGECAIRELQGWRPRAPGGGGVRGGRELQWKARRQGAAARFEEAGEAWGERKRENGREGVKVEDSNFRGFFCKNSCHVAPCQEVWT